jgi:nucleotide-binding universal stress UspA family protein
MATITRILVPTDFSASSRAALDLACDLASRLGLPLTVLHAYALPAYPLPEGVVLPTSEQTAETITRAARALHGELEHAQAHGVEARSLLAEGDPFDAIVRTAGELGADLIVMGTHGRRGIAHALLGSVAEKLVQKGPCPVLTVRAAS